MINKELGYYWVKYKGEYIVAKHAELPLSGTAWYIDGKVMDPAEFDDIDCDPIGRFRRSWFSEWLKGLMPANSDFFISDIDFVLYDKVQRKIAIIESKCMRSEFANWQHNIYRDVSEWITTGMEHEPTNKKWDNAGVYLVQFERTGFHNGTVWVNGKECTEDELKTMLKNFTR